MAVAPLPYSFPPSQYWDGNDGPWSSFSFRVGSPPQYVRLLISTASPETSFILPSGCDSDADASCPDLRGKVFNPNSSATWDYISSGYTGLEGSLNYSIPARYGLDSVGLTPLNSTGPTLDAQVVAAFKVTDFWMGTFGLAPRPVYINNFDPHQSYLSTLKAQNKIPSLSWAYTAGAPYRLKKVFGSLVLGGYDQARFYPNTLSFPFAPDGSRDIVVGVQAITSTQSNGTSELLLPSGILSFVDSTLPYIWLPLAACQRFENLLGLRWDNTSQLYLVDDALHDSIIANNYTFTFHLGNSQAGGATIEIVLPYASFDLTASFPLVANNTRYFPLKRAANDTQYILGRAFLQEAYLIADYERNNFSISQTLFQDSPQENLVAIRPIVSQNATVEKQPSREPARDSLQPGLIAVIVIGIFFLALLVFGAFLFFTKRRPFKRTPVIDQSMFPEEVKAARNGSDNVSEMPSSLRPSTSELDTDDSGKVREVHSSHKIELQGQQEGELSHNTPGVGSPSLFRSQARMTDDAIRHELPGLLEIPSTELRKGR